MTFITWALGREEAPEHFFRRTAITSPHCQEFMVWRIFSIVTIFLSDLMLEVTLMEGIFELFQHEKNGKFLERLQTFRKSLSICRRAGNQVFMWFVTFWGCPEPIFSTPGVRFGVKMRLLQKLISFTKLLLTRRPFGVGKSFAPFLKAVENGFPPVQGVLW